MTSDPTMSPSATNLAEPQRQSSLAIVFLGLRIIGRLGIAQLLLIAFFVIRGASDGRLLALTVVVAAVLAATSVLAWWRYTFQLVDRELVVTKGVLSVDRLTVPVDRIQSVTIEQELLHRLTGLVKVSVDTAGSNDAEFTIDAVNRSVAEALQQQTLATARAATTSDAASTNHTASRTDVGDGHSGVAPPPPEAVLFAHGPRRLLIAALTSAPWAALVLLAPLVALGDDFAEQVGAQPPSVDPDSVRWWWVPIAVIAFLVLSVVTNIVSVLLQHWRLTVHAGPDVVRRTSGLLSTTNRASSPNRVQVVTNSQNPLQQAAGIRTVGLSSIGAGDLSLVGCDEQQTRIVYGLVGARVPEPDTRRRRIDRAEIWLAVRNTTLLAAVVAMLGVWRVGWWTLLVLLLVPWVWATRRRHVRTFRWSLDAELGTTSHVVVRSSKQALLRKANGVQVTQSMFERRRGLGRVHLDTAAGTVSVGMIPIATARAVRDVILHAAETDHRPWM